MIRFGFPHPDKRPIFRRDDVLDRLVCCPVHVEHQGKKVVWMHV